MSDRYQNQCFVVRLYRWCRWKPYCAFVALWVVTRWFITGAKIPEEDRDWFSSKCSYAKFLWRITGGEADYKMKHYYSLDEMKEKLLERIGDERNEV